MIPLMILLVCLAIGVFIYIKHKQSEREANRHERMEEKQEELLEILRKRKTDEN